MGDLNECNMFFPLSAYSVMQLKKVFPDVIFGFCLSFYMTSSESCFSDLSTATGSW